MAEKAKRELFECECGCKQPINNTVKKSVKCLGCETEYAIVNDGEGNKVFVPYFEQSNKKA